MDQENEFSKIFIISLRLIGRTGKGSFKFRRLYMRIQPAKLINHGTYYPRDIIR